MKIAELRSKFHSELSGLFPSEEIQSLFAMLADSWLGYSRLQLSLHASEEISSEMIPKFLDAIKRLKTMEPVQYILGTTEFYGLNFEVTPDTLIPRPETEELVDWIIREQTGHEDILDIGTGSGCIAVSLARHSKNSVVDAMDISASAIEVARRNAAINKAEVNFIVADVLNINTLSRQYDIIVSNPPYVRISEKESMSENVLRFEPETALYVPDDDPLKFYRQIAGLARGHLKKDGHLFFEINEYLSKEMVSMLRDHGFAAIELRQDFRGRNRFIKCTPDSNE